MLGPVIIDCQTQTSDVACEYCIANKECLFRYRIDRDSSKETLTFSVEDSSISVVYN